MGDFGMQAIPAHDWEALLTRWELLSWSEEEGPVQQPADYNTMPVLGFWLPEGREPIPIIPGIRVGECPIPYGLRRRGTETVFVDGGRYYPDATNWFASIREQYQPASAQAKALK
jgi:hypothetical protein